MRRLIPASLLGACALLHAAEYAPQDFDFSALAVQASEFGFVESVREVPAPQDFHAFRPDVLEHRSRQAEELTIRLDAGHAVTVIGSDELPRLQQGERVRVTLMGAGLRVERQGVALP